MAKHSLLSPSSAHRWLKCTQSARLCENIPKSTSDAAFEGTLAHEVAEIMLACNYGQITSDVKKARLEQLQSSIDEYDEDFLNHVKNYVAVVTNIISEYNEDAKILLEKRVDMSHIVPNGSGTADVIIIDGDTIHVIDLKFGRMKVEAPDNPQLRLYALGALNTYQTEGPFKTVKMTIIQPRLNNVSNDQMSVKELNNWANIIVKPRAELAHSGKGNINPGQHCTFCPMRDRCAKLADYQIEQAELEFSDTYDVTTLTPETISRILTIGPQIKQWLEDVESYAKKLMISACKPIPNFKVVGGRNRRVIANADDLAKRLNADFPEVEIWETKMLPITKLEKAIGKTVFNKKYGDLILTMAGKPTIAPADDKRPELTFGDEFN